MADSSPNPNETPEDSSHFALLLSLRRDSGEVDGPLLCNLRTDPFRHRQLHWQRGAQEHASHHFCVLPRVLRWHYSHFHLRACRFSRSCVADFKEVLRAQGGLWSSFLRRFVHVRQPGGVHRGSLVRSSARRFDLAGIPFIFASPTDHATHHHHHSHSASSHGEEELAEDLRRHPRYCRSHDRSALPLPSDVGGGTLRRRRDGQGRHHRLLLLLRQLLEQLVVRGTSPPPRLNRRCFPSRWCASTLRSPSRRCRTASALCW